MNKSKATHLNNLYGATASGLYRFKAAMGLSVIINQSSVIQAMRRIYEQIIDLRPAILGTAGTGATAILDGVNAAVGILVGLATLVYLIVRIQRELMK